MQRIQSFDQLYKNKARPDSGHNILNQMIKNTKAIAYPTIKNNQNVMIYF
jgi:hypothetical protein